MKRFICIFALLLFSASCGEVTIPDFSPCQLMTISDALPVQFWQQGCNTYNETVPKGVHEKCFCHPWNCDDQIRVQFKEDFSPDTDYLLLVKDSNAVYRAELLFSEIEAGVHSVAFSPETEGICDEVIALEIVDEVDIYRLLNASLWSDVSGLGTFDSKSGSTFNEALTSADPVIAVEMSLVVPAGKRIGISYRVDVNGTWTSNGANPILVTFNLLNASGSVATASQSNTERTISANGSYEYTETLTATSESTVLRITLQGQIATGTANVFVVITPDSIIYADPLAETDCLDVRLSHDETELIEYANSRTFAGLVYSDISPDASFNIRVPCRFFHEVFPEEDEAIELTSSVITTSGSLKSQKLLEVQHVPYYFHKKLQLILKHQTLTINDIAYQKEEKYEIIEGSKRWPLKSATCLLTEKGSVLRNVI